jgi:hypothetical protein
MTSVNLNVSQWRIAVLDAWAELHGIETLTERMNRIVTEMGPDIRATLRECRIASLEADYFAQFSGEDANADN